MQVTGTDRPVIGIVTGGRFLYDESAVITDFEQKIRDDTHIKLLAIFDFVQAGFSLLGTIFIGFHYLIMNTVILNNPKFWERVQEQQAAQHQPPMPFDPQQFFHIFVWFYVVFGVWGVISVLANIAAGICLLQRSARIFCIAVGVLNCFSFPIGTVLGIFMIIVLVRPSVIAQFQRVLLPAVPQVP